VKGCFWYVHFNFRLRFN